MNPIRRPIPFSVRSATEPGLHLRVEGFPAPLVGGPFPNRHQPDWQVLRRAEVRYLVCLASTQPEMRYDPLPAGMSWLVKADLPEIADLAEPVESNTHDLADTGRGNEVAAKTRRDSRAELLRIAHRILAVLWSGEGVMVHCEYGVERTGLLIALVLTLGGSDRVEVVTLVADALEPHVTVGEREKRLWLRVINAMEDDAGRGLGNLGQMFDEIALEHHTADRKPRKPHLPV